MNKRKYSGTWTAIITPFTASGEVDEMALRKIIQRQIENGVTGIVPVGTTGESPTTTFEEDARIYEIAVEEARKAGEGSEGAGGGRKVMVMAGTGSNCTRDAVKYTEAAKKAGADCCLVVAPYYNKPTPAGLLLHYRAIADVGLPVIVYNIKGRTGINIETDTLMEMAKHPMIVGVKEASSNLDQMREVIAQRPEDFTVLCGDDGLTLELIKMGGDGVISVAANLVPERVSEMVEYALVGNMGEAEKIHQHLEKLFGDIFVETNPIPVKYIAHKMDLCELVFRLPMCPPSDNARTVLDETIATYNLAK